MRAMAWVLTAAVALPLVGCTDSAGIRTPTAASAAAPPSTITAGLKAAALGGGVTDVTLANAGWTCIAPGNGLVLCAPPGLGLPSIPPSADGRPSYEIMVFTVDHAFVHHVKLRRPDLYHGEPCQGGDPWIYVDFLDYYECIVPAHGE